MSILDKLLGRTKPDSREARRRVVPIKRRTKRSTLSRKVWYMLTLDGHEVLTPWARKERQRRRAANRVAKQSRKVNRHVRATGGLR